MRILNREEIKIPVGGLVVGEDHPIELLGALGGLEALIGAQIGEIPAVLFPEHDASIFEENNALQRNGLFDPYDCVTCAHQSQIDILHQAIFKLKQPLRSRRFTAVRSGTQPHVGNSNYNVEQSIQRNGMVNEVDCVSMTPTMTEEQFFAPIPNMSSKEAFLRTLSVKYFLVPTVDGRSATNVNLWDSLSYSPIVVSVNGHYDFDSEGRVIRIDDSDSHDVLLLRSPTPTDQSYLVLDSENPHGIIKFSPFYDFHYPVLAFLSKRVPTTLDTIKKKVCITLHDLFTKYLNLNLFNS